MRDIGILARLVRRILGRDDAVPAAAGPAPLPADPPGAASADEAPAFDDATLGILSEKILLAWLRNRYQLLFPFSLDLSRLDRRQAGLFIQAMVAAAQADGQYDRIERERIEGALRLVNPSREERALLEQSVLRPRPLVDLLAEVRDVQTGALVYAASLMAVDRRQAVNRHYLRYLAARLQLSPELVESLEKRYQPVG